MSKPKRIGVMIPSTNTTCEADFQRVVPPGVTVHGQRMWMTNEPNSEAKMERMNADIESGIQYLSTANVDLVAYGCTTGSFFKGAGWDQALVAMIEREAGVPAVATSPAAVAALRSLGAKKISIATPYRAWNNDKLRDYMSAAGFEVLNAEGDLRAAAAGPQGINDHDPETVVDFAERVCRDDADVLFCGCTAWRAMEAVEELEARTGKPVVTSNQATIWASLGALGIDVPIVGFGRLLQGSSAHAAC
jgi:maleate isomerase